MIGDEPLACTFRRRRRGYLCFTMDSFQPGVTRVPPQCFARHRFREAIFVPRPTHSRSPHRLRKSARKGQARVRRLPIPSCPGLWTPAEATQSLPRLYCTTPTQVFRGNLGPLVGEGVLLMVRTRAWFSFGLATRGTMRRVRKSRFQHVLQHPRGLVAVMPHWSSHAVASLPLVREPTELVSQIWMVDSSLG